MVDKPTDQGSDSMIIDQVYLSKWGFAFAADARKWIEALAAEFGGCDDKCSSRLGRERFEVSAFIKEAYSCYMRRYLAEYRYILDLDVDLYPYKYINLYGGKAIPRKGFSSGHLLLDFVYCGELGSGCLESSVASLVESFRYYTKRSACSSVTLMVTLVEKGPIASVDLRAIDTAGVAVRHVLVELDERARGPGVWNVAIEQSCGDMMAFADPSLLFPEQFFDGLSALLLSTEIERHVYAINLFEACTHEKKGVIFSKGSPCGYLLMANRRSLLAMGGLEEDVVDGGFVPGDLESRLTRVGGLVVTDSISVNPSVAVLHVAESASRSGDAQSREVAVSDARDVRGDAVPPVSNKRAVNVIAISEASAVGKFAGSSSTVDFLFIPHNKYHAETCLHLRSRLSEVGKSAVLLDVRGHYPDEGAYLPRAAMAYVTIAELLGGRCVFRALACMNDWEGKIAAPLVEYANSQGIPTIGVVEGVNDFNDVDTKRKRRAYRRVRHVLLNGEFDRRYFVGSDQDISVCGLQRLDGLMERAWNGEDRREGDQRIAVANVNFTYGVLGAHRAEWLGDVKAVADEVGIDLTLSVHHAERTAFPGYEVAKDSLYQLLGRCHIFISRFSGAILEALALKANVIYYNPGFEKVDKFEDPMGAYWIARSRQELAAAMQEIMRGVRKDPTSFLKLHADIEPHWFGEPPLYGSLERTRDVIVRYLDSWAQSGTADLDRLRSSLRFLDDDAQRETT